MLSNRQLFLLNTAQTSTSPRAIEITLAEGVFLFGPGGKKYMDLVSGFAVSNTGHRHPEVVQAIKDQADQYLHVTVYGEFIQSPQVRFAEKLASILPPDLSCVYFVNSGAEATEGAMKLARRYTGRYNILSCVDSYHGSTQGALSLMGNEYYKKAYRPLIPGIKHIRFNNITDLAMIDKSVAAVFIETIQGEAGVRVPDAGYMHELRRRCDETGTLLVMDEIQSGFGRTGKLFAFQHFGVRPDILLLAKGMGGGMPIGAFISSKDIMAVLTENPILGHITTFGGHPVSCAAGLANLNVILRDSLWEGVAEKERLLREHLEHPVILEIRGRGLMLAIQLADFSEVESVCNYCQDHGVLVDWFLHCETAVRIAPPLIITHQQIKEACTVIKQALDQLPARQK